jgi:esterase/lipase superfamily enzyme
MHPERVVIARVSAVVAAVVTITVVIAVVVVAAAVGAFRSLLLGHLFPNVNIVIISSSGRPRARAMIVGVVAIPIILRFGRHLLVVLPLHALDAR